MKTDEQTSDSETDTSDIEERARRIPASIRKLRPPAPGNSDEHAIWADKRPADEGFFNEFPYVSRPHSRMRSFFRSSVAYSGGLDEIAFKQRVARVADGGLAELSGDTVGGDMDYADADVDVDVDVVMGDDNLDERGL